MIESGADCSGSRKSKRCEQAMTKQQLHPRQTTRTTPTAPLRQLGDYSPGTVPKCCQGAPPDARREHQEASPPTEFTELLRALYRAPVHLVRRVLRIRRVSALRMDRETPLPHMRWWQRGTCPLVTPAR